MFIPNQSNQRFLLSLITVFKLINQDKGRYSIHSGKEAKGDIPYGLHYELF